MKRITLYLMGIALIIIVGLTITNAQVQKQVKPKTTDVMAPLPASLDNFFPPKAEQPIYLLRMLGMAKPLSGIMADLSENDFANVMANFEQFKTQYSEVSNGARMGEKFPIGASE